MIWSVYNSCTQTHTECIVVFVTIFALYPEGGKKKAIEIQTFWVIELKNKLVLWQFWNGSAFASHLCALKGL